MLDGAPVLIKPSKTYGVESAPPANCRLPRVDESGTMVRRIFQPVIRSLAGSLETEFTTLIRSCAAGFEGVMSSGMAAELFVSNDSCAPRESIGAASKTRIQLIAADRMRQTISRVDACA